jgi:hypothetical protein
MCARLHRLGLPILAIAASLAGAPARAQEGPPATAVEPPAAPDRGVLVLVLPVDPADAETANALTELLIGAVASSDRASSIVGKEELQAQLQQSDEATLECIGSSACLGRLGIQLGVAEVLAATVARRGTHWLFDLHRLDPRSGESVAHVFREVEGELGALADAMLEALTTLDEEPNRSATLRVGVDVTGAEVSVDGELLGIYEGTLLEAELAPGTHEIRARAEGHVDWVRAVELGAGDDVRLEAALRPEIVEPPAIPPPPDVDPPPSGETRLSPVLWVGMSVAVLGAGSALGFGISSRREPAEGVNRAEALAFTNDRKRDARTANAAVGIALAGVGLMGFGLWLSDFGGGEATAELQLSPRWGGAAATWSTRW